MEVESLELTVDDVLRLHRGWITKLFVNDRKSEVEIVELLYGRHLLVTCCSLSALQKAVTNALTGLHIYGSVFKIGTYCRLNLPLLDQIFS